MTKKIKFLAALIIIGFSSLIIIQSIYSKKEYESQSQEFKKDINRALEEAIRLANRKKTDSIIKLFERDFKDSNVVRFEFEFSDTSGPLVKVINPVTGYHSLTLNYSGSDRKDTLNRENLLELVRKNSMKIADPEIEGNIFYWTDPLAKRVESYKDTLDLDDFKLNNLLDQELQKRFVFGKYELLKYESDTLFSDSLVNGIASNAIPLGESEDKDLAVIVFEKPFLDIISRSWIILSTSFLVIVMMLIGFFTLFRIISKQRKLSQLKDDFMDNVTHELLTPISTLGIAIESLHKFNAIEDKDKAKKYLEMSQLELNRISDIVHNVLITSSQEKGEIEFKWESLKIKEVLAKLADYHITRSQKDVRIDITAPENLEFRLDRQHFSNVINNLLDNAIKYGKQDGVQIQLIAESEENQMVIYVKDNGPGIDLNERARIFEKFHRAHKAGTKGLGIGLYYVKSILGQMNGEIQLQESSKNGSIFKVSLKK